MGNSGGRPSCLGEKSPKTEDFLKDTYLKDLGLDSGPPAGRNKVTGRTGPPDKAPLSPGGIENGWWSTVVLGPKQNNMDGMVPNGSLSCNPLHLVPLEANSAAAAAGAAGWSWPWKPHTTAEVTEVTEVTETIVTEIVEVTEYLGGAKRREPIVTRTVTVRTECTEALPELQSSGRGRSLPADQQDSLSHKGIPSPLGELWRMEQVEEMLQMLLSWATDMEDLMTSQKPPSSEVKVVRAQLQEQKLLSRLLDERRSHVEGLLDGRQMSPEPSQEWDRSLANLREKWTALIQGVEARQNCLERVLCAAHAFQDSVDSFQDWLGPTERNLVQLWQSHGSMTQAQAAHQQIQDLGEEMSSKPAELERALRHGQQLLEMVAGEEAQLAQEKMASLRMRFLVVGQSSSNIRQRLEQTLEASPRLDPAQENLALWLGRMEKELPLLDSQLGEKSNLISAADRERFEQALASEMAQVCRLSKQLEQLGPIPLDAHSIHVQLAYEKLLSAEILCHHDLVERLVALTDPLLSFFPAALQRQLQPSVQPLQECSDHLWRQSAARTRQLEHVQLLLAQYAEAHAELLPWLEEAQQAVARFSLDTIRVDEAFGEQQELLQCLQEAVVEHKPLVGKLQRLSAHLAGLNAQEAVPFQQGWQMAEEQYSSLREHACRAADLLEDAIPRYSQLSERTELMVECLERLQRSMQDPPAVRGDPAWFREQIRDNSLRLAELEKLGVSLETLRGQGAELLATVQSSANQALQARVEQLLARWQELWAQGEEREAWLRAVLALADRLWQGLWDLTITLRDIQQRVLDLEEGPLDPQAIQARLRTMQALREDIDALQADLDSLGIWGMELTSSCGNLEKPDVTKRLDDLFLAWRGLSQVWAQRRSRLEEQLEASLTYRETMERMLCWLEVAELRIAEEFLVGGDLDKVKQQLLELKDFKRELYQNKVAMESLRHQGISSGAGAGSRDPSSSLSSFRHRWNGLEEEVLNRQHHLEAALLGLGQFQNQLEELLQWLERTSEQLQGPTPRSLDLQSCEIELAKHEVLRNDILSHSRTVHSVTEAGQGLLLSRAGGGSVDGLQGSLQQLSQRWDFVLGEVESRRLELQNNLSQVQDLTLEITDLLRWLEHVQLQLFISKPSWSQPEATKNQLAAHLELSKEMESKQQTYSHVRTQLQHLLTTSHHLPRASSTQHSLSMLEQKWESVASQVQERKEQLNQVLVGTTEFHSTLQELLKWVGHMEEGLGSLPAASYILATVTSQIQEQKTLVRETQAQGEKLAGLRDTAARINDFSQKHDSSIIQSLVLSASKRLAKVQQQVAKRGTLLEEARKRAKQFSESWQLLLDWLEEVDMAPDRPSDAALNQEGIKRLLREHQEFQKGLRAKRPVYEATLRSGRLLREKALLPEDAQPLDEMLGELKERWDAVGTGAADRPRKLEESLLFSGCFTDALQTLMDWLYRVEPQLAEEAPVAGDKDLVGMLLDKHKAFQKELGQKAGCIKTLRRSVRDLTRGSSAEDSQWLQNQIEELDHRWELTCQLSVSKQGRLEAALRQAEEFHMLVQSFLGRLSELEKQIKHGVLPKEEAAVQAYKQQLEELSESLQCQQLELECLTSLGEEILSTCHPDSVTTIKSWVTVAKSRLQEVRSWAQQQDERLQIQAASLAAEREEVARLMDWITAAEESLDLRDQEPLPEDSEQLEELNCQHVVFMEELNRKQPDVEKVTKSCKHNLTTQVGLVPASRKVFSRRREASSKSIPMAPAVPLLDRQPQSPLLAQLLHRWQHLWLLALDRQYRLQSAQQHLRELEEFAQFNFAAWRKRYMQWISQKKSRVLDIFRGIDRDQDGRISQQEFIRSVLSSRFATNMPEMSAVASILDTNGDGFIDYSEFVSALHPSRDLLRRTADADQIQDEVNRQVAQCNCAKRFQVEQISANRYRFGESQQLRLVRILRSTLMVRVGGGWIALDEFLVKNDPCRVKGRTNLKLNEKYLSPDSSSGQGAGSQPPAPTCKVPPLPSRSSSSSSLSLSSSASAPSSPLRRKFVLRRTRSGDRSLHAGSFVAVDGAEPAFAAGPEGEPVLPEPLLEGPLP